MSGNALETAGTVSGGGTVAIALGWVEVNSTALSTIVMIITMFMMGAFYAASIYMRKIEVKEKAKSEVIKELYEKIGNVEASDLEKHAAKTMLKEVMNRRDQS